MSIFSDFYGAAAARVQSGIESITPARGSGGTSTGSAIFEALYQYGRGRTEQVSERLAEAVRSSSHGQEIEREIEQKRIKELLPMILAGLAGIVLLFLYMRR